MQNLFLSLLVSSSAAVAAARPGGSHGAFKARGPAPVARQQNVQRWDFTKIANPSVPAPIADFAQSQGAGATHEYFSTAEWNDVWSLQSWSKDASDDAPTRMTNSLNNIYIQQNTDAGAAADETFLTMRTVRHDGFQSAAQIESRRNDYQYVTMKMRARTVGDAGACTAMFTYYLPDGGKVQEADLEILTKEADNIAHYTNQPSYDGDQEFPEATVTATLPTSWNTWQEHTLEWTPGSSDWYVDGQKVASIQFQAPVDPTTLVFNAWSDGGSWSGNMEVGGSAEMQIQWIEITTQ
ncbi:hypothetical protein SLS62_005415 [Diatrype stigma]|uniref:GH16 domain-containing protein n=1 Tax=Diatrype stigma TaxID=117547 RepID=A0AAN9YPR7_9PEZI